MNDEMLSKVPELLSDYFIEIQFRHLIRDHPYITSAYFWTFSDPPTHYVNLNTVLNVGQNGHFPNPPIHPVRLMT